MCKYLRIYFFYYSAYCWTEEFFDIILKPVYTQTGTGFLGSVCETQRDNLRVRSSLENINAATLLI